MQVTGLCYINGRLYSIERRRERPSNQYRLAVYGVNNDTITLLETLHLDTTASLPFVGRFSGRVYIPCLSRGVRIVLYDGSKLGEITTLSCVRNPRGVAEVSPSTLYVCDLDTRTVCQVDVNQDAITANLQEPPGFERRRLEQVAFLGDTVLVRYSNSLVAYRHGIPSPGKLITRPGILKGLTTDHHSSFILVGDDEGTGLRNVFVLDLNGTLTHTVPVSADRKQSPHICAVVGERLWLVCRNGDILVMSSE